MTQNRSLYTGEKFSNLNFQRTDFYELVTLTLITVAAAAAAKLIQSCPTLCNPIDRSPPGSPVLGFSRQEYGSGLPFPSPMHERKSESEVALSCPTLGNSMDLQPTRLLHQWDFPGKSTGMGCHCLLY